MEPLQPQSVRRFLDRRMEVHMVGEQQLMGRLLSVSGGLHPTMWLTEVDGEETDVVLGLDRIVDCQLVEESRATIRFASTPMPSMVDSIVSPGSRKR